MEFHKLSCQIYKDHPDGFHVHVDRIEKVISDKDATSPLRKTIKYIGRYLGRPPIAMSRIDNFDEEPHRGTFHTTPHEPHEELAPGEPMFETLHMLCFAMRLIRHKRVTLSLRRQGHFHSAQPDPKIHLASLAIQLENKVGKCRFCRFKAKRK